MHHPMGAMPLLVKSFFRSVRVSLGVASSMIRLINMAFNQCLNKSLLPWPVPSMALQPLYSTEASVTYSLFSQFCLRSSYGRLFSFCIYSGALDLCAISIPVLVFFRNGRVINAHWKFTFLILFWPLLSERYTIFIVRFSQNYTPWIKIKERSQTHLCGDISFDRHKSAKISVIVAESYITTNRHVGACSVFHSYLNKQS